MRRMRDAHLLGDPGGQNRHGEERAHAQQPKGLLKFVANRPYKFHVEFMMIVDIKISSFLGLGKLLKPVEAEVLETLVASCTPLAIIATSAVVFLVVECLENSLGDVSLRLYSLVYSEVSSESVTLSYSSYGRRARVRPPSK
ncbi:hypothetical protein NFJ02_19g34420 [Pycnococcus provasolii]